MYEGDLVMAVSQIERPVCRANAPTLIPLSGPTSQYRTRPYGSWA